MTFRIDRFSMNEAAAMAGGDARLGRIIKGRFDKTFSRIETQINDILDVQAATDAANAAASAANAAAAVAQTTANDITSSDQLAKSYVSGAGITATDAGANVTITITAHTRHYPQPDGTTIDKAINGGSLTGRAYSTDYWIIYSDPEREGGAVVYSSATSEAAAAQIGDTHCVGAVATPAAAGAPKAGAYTRPPGPGQIGELP